MKCLRCARETADRQVFCNACLDDMARHPVRSDTPIYLPVRKAGDTPKRPARRFRRERTAEEIVFILRKRTAEEIVFILRKRVRVLTALVVILVMMLAAAVTGVWLAKRQGGGFSIPDIGQNFQSITDLFKGTNEE